MVGIWSDEQDQRIAHVMEETKNMSHSMEGKQNEARTKEKHMNTMCFFTCHFLLEAERIFFLFVA